MCTKTKKRFIIVGVARSGTTLVLKAIEGHPLVNCVRGDVCDYLVADAGPDIFTYNNVATPSIDPVWATKCNLNYLFNIIGESRDIVGLKTAFHSPDVAARFSERVAAADKDVKIIAVIRRDFLAIEASMLLALKLGRFHSYSSDKLSNKRIVLDPVKFSRSVLRYSLIIDQIQKLKSRMDYLEISYENEILSGDLSFYDKICRFLDIDAVEPSWLNMKKQARPPAEYVKNYVELRSVEKATMKSNMPLPETFSYRIRRKIKWISASLAGS